MNNLLHEINTPIATTIVGALLAALFGFIKYIQREKLKLNYSITESDFFPLEDGQGKYCAVNIANGGGTIIKNIIAEIGINDSTLESITSHDLVSNVEKLDNKIRIHIPSLNPKEDLSLVLTSKVSENSEVKMKLRAEGVNGQERKVNPSAWDFSGVAAIAGLIGFFAAILWIDLASPDMDKGNKTNAIYSELRKVGLSDVFYKMVESHDDISYQYTAYFLLAEYVKNPSGVKKYESALNSLANTSGILDNSLATIYYVLYKIKTFEGDKSKATVYLEKCRDSSKDTYHTLVENDIYEKLDSIAK